MPYIELDHRLKPRKLEEINDRAPLPDHKKDESAGKMRGFGEPDTFLVNKFNIEKKQVQSLIPLVEKIKLKRKKEETEAKIKYRSYLSADVLEDKNGWKKEDEILLEKLEPVIGPDKEVNFDKDWGLFSAVLACYNNHWVLKTGPEDWWTVVCRRIAAALDDHGEVEAVRKFFVSHEGQKQISVNVGPTLSNIDYSWLFNQFSSEIRRNIQTPGYVDLMEADFSTTSPEQKIISQIMLMSSVKKYFAFGMHTACGVPGVEMKGSEQDWEMLVNKLNNLETQLRPILEHLNLNAWFLSTKLIFNNLLKTYKGQPDKDWWGHILCWNQTYGSGASSWFSGWFPEFLGCNNNPEGPNDFPSGLVTVPLHIEDKNNSPPVEDDGLLVAGTLGFTISAGNNDTPVIEPHNTWSLLLPENSPVTPRLKPSA